jgi:hypoxanthine phosphoribosyltransferase
MAKQISHDYAGKTLHALGILENGFIFLSDLVRAVDVPVICQFVKPKYHDDLGGLLEIFFSHDLEVKDQHVLLVEGILHSGVTAEFLINDLRARGAASVKIASLLDRQSARRVQLQPDYFGFLVDGTFLMGYGLGSREQTNRNLPYLAVAT